MKMTNDRAIGLAVKGGHTNSLDLDISLHWYEEHYVFCVAFFSRISLTNEFRKFVDQSNPLQNCHNFIDY